MGNNNSNEDDSTYIYDDALKSAPNYFLFYKEAFISKYLDLKSVSVKENYLMNTSYYSPPYPLFSTSYNQ